MLCRREAGQRMDGRQARIASPNAVVTRVLKKRDELSDRLRSEAMEVDLIWMSAGLAGNESQVQHDRIAVASNRMRAHAAQRWKIDLEELDQALTEIVGSGSFHEDSPCISL